MSTMLPNPGIGIHEKLPFQIDGIPLVLVFQHDKWHITLEPNRYLEDDKSTWPVSLVMNAFLHDEHHDFYRDLFRAGKMVNNQDYALIPLNGAGAMENEAEKLDWKVGTGSDDAIVISGKTMGKLLALAIHFQEDCEGLVHDIRSGTFHG